MVKSFREVLFVFFLKSLNFSTCVLVRVDNLLLCCIVNYCCSTQPSCRTTRKTINTTTTTPYNSWPWGYNLWTWMSLTHPLYSPLPWPITAVQRNLRISHQLRFGYYVDGEWKLIHRNQSNNYTSCWWWQKSQTLLVTVVSKKIWLNTSTGKFCLFQFDLGFEP